MALRALDKSDGADRRHAGDRCEGLGLTQAYVSDVARGRYRTITVENAREIRLLLRLPYRGSVPGIPPNVGMNEDGPSEAPAPKQS